MRRALLAALFVVWACASCRAATPPAGATPGVSLEATCTPVAAPAATRTDTPTPTSTSTPTMTPKPPTPASTPTSVPPTPEPVLPTREVGTPTLSATPPVSCSLPAVAPAGRERFGVGVPERAGVLGDYAVERLGMGWYLNWRVEVAPLHPNGAVFWQMVRVSEKGYWPDAAAIGAAARANPGAVWLIGNEPDVRWQDNTTPERYAEWYGELYALLKSVDPTARVAIGGVAQPTPLRLAYLDRVLAAYEARYGAPITVDVWNVHNFILREERNSWGVDIPPGLDASSGMLYEIDDHDDLDLFKQQIVDFRRWMDGRGQRDKPLAVSEYGIVMPPDYGFDLERVQAFMYASFDYFLTATDAQLGYPPDGNRLVQWWCWFSLADTTYPTGNLFDPQTRAVTPLGAAFARYAPPRENVKP